MIIKKWHFDAGHGGNDEGATGATGSYEKDVVLNIALLCKEIMLFNNQQVSMSRETDVYVGLSERADMSDSAGANFLISIHCNHSGEEYEGTARGSEVFHVSQNGYNLGLPILNEIVQILPPSRGMKTANFTVLVEPIAPAVLVELGFINNVEDEKLLTDPAIQKEIAIAICKGALESQGIAFQNPYDEQANFEVRVLLTKQSEVDSFIKTLEGKSYQVFKQVK